MGPRRREKGPEKISEDIIAEKETVTPVQEVQSPSRINPRRNTPRHTLIKLSKIKYKEKILKAAREKQQITQGNPHKVNS